MLKHKNREYFIFKCHAGIPLFIRQDENACDANLGHMPLPV